LVEVREEHSADISSAATPTKSAPRFITPAPQADKFLEAAVVSAAPEAKAPSASPTSVGRGAASAPAPAREREDSHAAQTLSAVPSVIESHSKTSAVVQDDSPAFVGSAPSFTFGGNVPAESSGGGKKILAAVAVVVVMAAGAYAGWTHFQGHAAQPAATQTESGPASVATPQTAKPGNTKPSATFAPTSAPKTSASLPNSQSAVATTSSHISNGSSDGGSNADSASDENDASVSSSAASISPKRSNSPSSAVTKTTAAVEEPLVVKGGKAPAVHAKSLAPDAPAPSMIGIAATGVGAPPPNFVSSGEIVPKPLLQTLNISQGVSRGLLIKKVQPTYPRNAMAVRLEGSVELLATISKTGDISHIKVQSGDSLLAKAATDAVKQWKYKPYLLNGEPVEIQTQVTINFKLPK
jgi:TonB family protein